VLTPLSSSRFAFRVGDLTDYRGIEAGFRMAMDRKQLIKYI